MNNIDIERDLKIRESARSSNAISSRVSQVFLSLGSDPLASNGSTRAKAINLNKMSLNHQHSDKTHQLGKNTDQSK